MKAFAYARPRTVKEAIAQLGAQWGEAEVLAGGTDLISLMKDGVAKPDRIVNIKGIRELGGIDQTPEGLRIGALVTIEELLTHPHLREALPALHGACAGITSPQMRNMGTAGGDLLQRPRCWYYRAGFGLLARDAQGRALVPAGDNRYHAIFGNGGPAYFVNPSSLAPALIALGASVQIAGPSGMRKLTVEELFITPGSESDREHAIAPNEILTEILIPSAAHRTRNATYEVRQKEAMDWPLATASVAMGINAGKIDAPRVVLGHVAPVPWTAKDAEKYLEGKTLNEETATGAGEAAVQGATPLRRNGYKVQLARVAVKRAVLACMERPQRKAAADERASAAQGGL